MWVVNIIVAIFALICFFSYRSYKKDYETTLAQLRALSKEFEDCKIRVLRSAEIVSKVMDSNRGLLVKMAQQEDQSECDINYSIPLTDYYKEQNKLLQELLDTKNPYDLLEEKKKYVISFETNKRIIEKQYQGEISILKERYKHLEKLQSNLTAIPYMAAIVADYETYGLEILAKKLDWGYAYTRAQKVASIREIRKTAQEMVERNLEAKYQLAYLIQLFPALDDIIETDSRQLPVVSISDLADYDKTRDWLSKEEYQNLSSTERNQLALDRYKASRNKTKWQIGRDYELYIGHKCTEQGYSVDYFGSYMGLEDLGRDLIAKKGKSVWIIQCKYWSKDKRIHENHITQLYGTTICYCLEKNIPKSNVKGVLVTNIQLSDRAKQMADYLKIKYAENIQKGDYPCIKCNIGRDELGITKIYHLPFDQQYDSTQINTPGEFFAMTVKEAEEKGFRRAFKWFGN